MEAENIMSWELKELWAYIKTIEDDLENPEDKINILKAKSGINIKIPINFIIKNFYHEQPEYLIVTVSGFGKYPLTTFHNEIDEREKILRSIIMEYNNGEYIITARGD